MILLGTIVLCSDPLAGQQDAAQAFRDGKVAFAAERFAEAGELFTRASHTDPDNPEVFLWLGRARYRVADLDGALAAWRRTLELAPEEPFAKRMVAALTGQDLDANARLAFAEALLRDRLLDASLRECRALRAEVALDAAQRARLTLLTARVQLERGDAKAAARELRALVAAAPDRASRPEVELAFGRAEVMLGGERLAGGLARLRGLAAGDAPAGVRARLELLRHALATRSDDADRAALAAWIGANGDHPSVVDARRLLLDAELRAAAAARVGADGALGDEMRTALAVAAALWPRLPAADRDRLVARFLDISGARYAELPAAAIESLEALRALGLGTDAERRVVRALARRRVQHALARLDAALRAGTPLEGEPSAALSAARAALAELQRLDPKNGAVSERLDLAAKLRALAARGELAEGLHPCERWSVEVAVQVARDASSSRATTLSIEAVGQVVDAVRQRGIDGLRAAVSAHDDLARAVSSTPEWLGVQGRTLELLDLLARAELAETLRAGSGTAPSEATDTQRALIAAAIAWVRRDQSVAAAAVERLRAHASAWSAAGRPEVAEQVLIAFAQGAPAAVAPRARLAAIELRLDAELGARERRAAAGLPVAARLEPALQRALEQLYDLEADWPGARAARARVVDHFVGMSQFAVAEQAIAVRGSRAVDRADAWAELRLADLRRQLAVAELDRVSRAEGRPPAEITVALRAALDAYAAFLTRRATSDLAASAVDAVLGIAADLDRRGAHDAAIAVYGELADTLGKLTAPLSLRRERAAQAAFAAAAATDARARKALGEGHGPKLEPATLAAVDAAIAAYADFVTGHGDSALIQGVLPRQLQLAVAVAGRGDWPAAERIFGRLLDAGVRDVGQLEFCKALCLLGPALPEHALAVLATAVVHAPLPTGAMVSTLEAGGGAGLFSIELGKQPAAEGAAREVLEDALARDEDRLLQTVRQLEQRRAGQIAALRGEVADYGASRPNQAAAAPDGLTPAELERIRRAFDAAYAALVAIRRDRQDSPYAEAARATMLAMVDRWRELRQWDRAAALARRFLDDHPRDRDRFAVRLGIARDLATLAARLPDESGPAHARLRTISARFDAARAAFTALLDAGGDDDTTRLARWERATTFLTQARTVVRLRASLARGRFVRAARELSAIAAAHPDDQQAAAVPTQLWAIGDELVSLGFLDEAVAVRRELWVRNPTHPMANQAALAIAQLYRGPLNQPLRAAELFQELAFARGGNDQGLQDAILAIGLELRAEQRWIEALHVLGSFVDSFPRHPRAGEALTQIGQVHQANGAYEDAIASYRRVIDEYPTGAHVIAARWSIAECWIHRSKWRDAADGYEKFRSDYPSDGRASEAARRIELLESLARYQEVVDEEGQRKAFDAQFQIAVIVRDRLQLPGKAIAEFAEVAVRWPKSHLADDALFEVGATHLAQGATDPARAALLRLARSYPESPLADDALYLVGKSYEDEADRLANVTRAQSEKTAHEQAQHLAYARARGAERRHVSEVARKIEDLKSQGRLDEAEEAEASMVASSGAFRSANTMLNAHWADTEAAVLTAAQLADREDRIHAALRNAVAEYGRAAQVAGGDKGGDALLRIARIHDTRLEDAAAAMATWVEIVRQFSGTAVAEDASWRIARFHDRNRDHREAIEAYQAFLRNYRRSPNAAAAQAAIAENHERLGEWVLAMDAYTNYINNFPGGEAVQRAREQIAWIKTYRL